MNKYRARKTEVDGIVFDSAAEARRWCELKLLEKAGEIRNLTRQITVPLVVNGQIICRLRPDFAFFEGQKRVYADAKGFETRDWKLKWKLAKAIFPSIEWRVLK